MNLTPEELEALRKKEERKDKLHQAYLRRKANGTQKRYEEKIKAKKKAEIEAKKAAIHAEDMEKGVFIPASSLPKKEPKKHKCQPEPLCRRLAYHRKGKEAYT